MIWLTVSSDVDSNDSDDSDDSDSELWLSDWKDTFNNVN